MTLLVATALAMRAQAGEIRLTAAAASLTGCRREGQGDDAVITNFVDPKAAATWRFPARAGIYDVRVRYSAPMGRKGFGIRVNGVESSGMFAPTSANVFATQSAGRVDLRAGENSLSIERGWGYFNVREVDLEPAVVATSIPKPPLALCDPQATPEARRLFGRLIGLYGDRCLSGQYGLDEAQEIFARTGRAPAILGSDFMDYSRSRVAHGSRPQGGTERVIAAARQGYLITMLWHWNAPSHLKDAMLKDADGHEINALWYKGFYTNATDFDLAQTLDHPDSEDFRLLLLDIDSISAELKKFQDAKIPVLWRPLHEAEGGWFWWGAKGPSPFKRLWRLMYERMTKIHGLHNLIWVYSSGTDPAWYPGDEWVDIVGIDAYPASPDDPLVSTWDDLQSRFSGRKLLAVTEFGGVPNISRMRKFGPRWSFFVSWVGRSKAPATSDERLREMYRSPFVDNR